MRPTWAEIDINSLKSNFLHVKKLIGNGTSIVSIVKADAYGHGAIAVSKALFELCGSQMFGVATVDEALELRESGIRAPILVLAGIDPNEAENVVKSELTPTIYSLQIASILNEYASKLGIRLGYHLKIDTGMTRLGVRIDELHGFMDEILRLKNLKMEGLFSHFSNADMELVEYTLRQIRIFKDIHSIINQAGVFPKYLHIANSSAIQRFPASHLNLVRPGIMLYGSGINQKVKLSPVMKLKTRVMQIKQVPPGVPISYGGTFVTKRPTVIAILPIGYADGYMRALSNRAKVSTKGYSAPVVGKVCMDLTIIDVTDVPGIKEDDEVILFGDESVTVEDVARWAGTISYEILSITGKRVPRVYV
ncbi:MAG TPA: alanine racemase [Thermodesulfobacteriota bacterium]